MLFQKNLHGVTDKKSFLFRLLTYMLIPLNSD